MITPRVRTYVLSILGPVAFLFVWFLVSATIAKQNIFFPGPITTCAKLLDLFIDSNIVLDIFMTVKRASIAFIASLFAVPIGFAVGYSKSTRDASSILIDFARSLPPVAIFPMLVLIFGIGDLSKIAAAVFASAAVIIFNTVQGLTQVSQSRVLVAKMMGASKLQIIRHVLFWESLPQVFTGIRIGSSISLIIIIVTEMLIGTNFGIGKKIIDYQYMYDITGMYAVIILVGICGYLFNFALAQLEKKIIHWQAK